MDIPLGRRQFSPKNYLLTQMSMRGCRFKSCLSSFLEIFKLGLFWNVNSTAIFITSVGGMLAKGLQTSYRTKK